MKAVWGCLLGFVLIAACDSEKKSADALSPSGRVNCAPERFSPDNAVIPHLQEVGRCGKFAGYLIASVMRGAPRHNAMPVFLESDSATAGDDGPAQYSKTNNQEAGVDEADFVKTDGKFTYILSGGSLVILKSWPAHELATISTTELAGYPTALLLEADRLAVVSQLDADVWSENTTARSFSPASRVTLLDVSDRSAPKVERTIDLELWYQDARLINGRMIFVGESSVPMPSLSFDGGGDIGVGVGGEDSVGSGGAGDVPVAQPSMRAAAKHAYTYDEVAEAIAATRYEQWIPSYVDSHDGKKRLVVDSFDDLFIPTVTGEIGGLSILTLDLTQPGKELTKRSLVARGGIVYASGDALVLSYSNGTWWWTCCGEPEAQRRETSLQSFRLNAEAIPTYAGAGTVPGWISSPFWMSEYKGNLRVASTGTQANYLTVLKPQGTGELDVIGKVWGFAPGETITGSRFVGEKAYIATYFMVLMKDPFFTFNLADATHPKLVGALDMPGFTQYIHPLSDEKVLGLGMFAEQMGDPVTAVQAQVFDVSDFANPVTAHQFVVATGDGRSFSEALGSHHAFTYYEPEKAFAFPVAIWDGSWNTAFNGLMVLRYDMAAGFSEIGRVNHQAYVDSQWWYGDVRRSIFMTADDGETYLYSISNGAIMVHSLQNFGSPLASAALPFQQYWDAPGAEPRYNPAPGIFH